jgi:hypothetical protein
MSGFRWTCKFWTNQSKVQRIPQAARKSPVCRLEELRDAVPTQAVRCQITVLQHLNTHHGAASIKAIADDYEKVGDGRMQRHARDAVRSAIAALIEDGVAVVVLDKNSLAAVNVKVCPITGPYLLGRQWKCSCITETACDCC